MKRSEWNSLVLWDKKSLLEKRDIHLASKKSFRCQKFSETTESTQWKFWKLCYRKNATEKHDTPLSHPWNFLATRHFLKHRRVLDELFLYYETKTNMTKFCDTPVLSICFSRYQTFFLKPRRVPKETFRYSDSNLFRRKNTKTSSLIHTKFSLPEAF